MKQHGHSHDAAGGHGHSHGLVDSSIVRSREGVRAVSHQLRLLRHLDLVVGERSGRRTIYALHDSHVGVLLEEAVYHVEHIRLGFPEPVSAKGARSR